MIRQTRSLIVEIIYIQTTTLCISETRFEPGTGSWYYIFYPTDLTGRPIKYLIHLLNIQVGLEATISWLVVRQTRSLTGEIIYIQTSTLRVSETRCEPGTWSWYHMFYSTDLTGRPIKYLIHL